MPLLLDQITGEFQRGANIRDAIQGCLHSLKEHNGPIPGPVAEEIVEVPI